MIPVVSRRRRQENEPGVRRTYAAAIGAALVTALLLALLGLVVWQRRSGKEARGDAAATDSLRQAARSAEVLLAPNARVALLSPTPSGPPDGRGRAVYDPATAGAVLVFDRLRQEAGATPVLWVLSQAEQRFLATLVPDATGRAVLHVEDAGGSDTIDGFAVSLEPDSVPMPPLAPAAPSGPVILLGVLER